MRAASLTTGACVAATAAVLGVKFGWPGVALAAALSIAGHLIGELAAAHALALTLGRWQVVWSGAEREWEWGNALAKPGTLPGFRTIFSRWWLLGPIEIRQFALASEDRA